MDNVKNDRYYAYKIQQDLEFIVLHMKNIDIMEFSTNEILLDSMLFPKMHESCPMNISSNAIIFRGMPYTD